MLFYLISNKRGVNAKAKYVDGKFIVLKGSVLSQEISEKFKGFKKVSERRGIEGLVVNRILQEDIVFNSSSIAGEFVYGNSCNGPITWKNANGITFKELKNQKQV